MPPDCNVYIYLQKNQVPDEREDLTVEIAVRAPEFTTTKKSAVMLYPILGFIFWAC